jgi:phosphatidylinositol kinase/protein kinase (PI-3  family)
VHIDFGFMLSNSPGGVHFERAPFKLTAEYMHIMESDVVGTPSPCFDYFMVCLFCWHLPIEQQGTCCKVQRWWTGQGAMILHCCASLFNRACCLVLLCRQGIDSMCWLQTLWCSGYEAAVKHREKVVQIVDMMQRSGCPCFVGGKRCVDALQRRLRADHAAIESLVTESIDAWTTRQYDHYQRAANGIL